MELLYLRVSYGLNPAADKSDLSVGFLQSSRSHKFHGLPSSPRSRCLTTDNILSGQLPLKIASFANLQYYSDKVWKFRQGELLKYTNLDQKLGILTANATTPYIVATVNLSETGPFVIDLPAGAIAGMVDDFWQRPVTDLGLPGPDKGKGAKYLVLPPGHKGDAPKDYSVLNSPTDNILIGIRLLDADPKKAAALQAKVRTYALKDATNPPKNLFPTPSTKYYMGSPRRRGTFTRFVSLHTCQYRLH